MDTAIALLLFLLPLAYSPGPGNMFFAANGARFGFRATIPANAGYHLATWLATTAIGFGFLAAMAEFPGVFVGLKLAGSLYVLWLAWKLFRSGAFRDSEKPKPATFLDGAALLVLNPKAYLIIALMFTQFLKPSDAGDVAPVLIIATVFTLNNLVAFSLWALVGDWIGRLFSKPESAGKLNMLFGAMLAGVAVWMALS